MPLPPLSFVVPYYNFRQAMPGLLDSILEQGIPELEVIVVDDASPSSCDDIVAEYAQLLNIRLIKHTERRYTKDARLAGVEAASADYIGFIDAGDRLFGVDGLRNILREIEQHQPDIVHFQAHIEEDGTKSGMRTWSVPLAPRLTGTEIFQQFVAQQRAWVIWNKFYKRSLWLKILDTAKQGGVYYFGEDFYLSVLLFLEAESYMSSDHTCYAYYVTNLQKKLVRKSLGSMATYYKIERDVLPYINPEKYGYDTVSSFACFLRKRINKKAQKLKKYIRYRNNDYRQVILDSTVHIDRRSLCSLLLSLSCE